MDFMNWLRGRRQPMISDDIETKEQLALAEEELRAARLALEAESLTNDDLARRLNDAEKALCALADQMPADARLDEKTSETIASALRRVTTKPTTRLA